MKKFLGSFVKSFVFFICWALLVGFVSIPSNNPVLWRFYAEVNPPVISYFNICYFLFHRKKKYNYCTYAPIF